MNSTFKTTSDFGKSSSIKFEDPNDYIYNAYLESSKEDAKKFLEYRENWNKTKNFETEFDFPLYILTEMTFTCNYTCPQCPLGDNNLQRELMPNPSIMSMDLFKKIIDEGERHKCRSFCVNNTNEPLLVKDIAERIQYARKKGFLDILMNTNGELLNEELSEKLIKSGLTRLMVSIDAHSEETFSKIRVGGNYEKVKNNVLNLVKIRSKLGQKLPLIRVSFVLQKDNEKELNEFKEFWETQVDYVHIQSFAKPYETSEDFRLTDKHNDLKDNFRCDQPWNRIMIRADGNIHPCCSFYTYDLGMGNINNSTISDIWNSQRFKELRKLHYEGRYEDNEACKKCVNSF